MSRVVDVSRNLTTIDLVEKKSLFLRVTASLLIELNLPQSDWLSIFLNTKIKSVSPPRGTWMDY